MRTAYGKGFKDAHKARSRYGDSDNTADIYCKRGNVHHKRPLGYSARISHKRGGSRGRDRRRAAVKGASAKNCRAAVRALDGRHRDKADVLSVLTLYKPVSRVQLILSCVFFARKPLFFLQIAVLLAAKTSVFLSKKYLLKI